MAICRSQNGSGSAQSQFGNCEKGNKKRAINARLWLAKFNSERSSTFGLNNERIKRKKAIEKIVMLNPPALNIYFDEGKAIADFDVCGFECEVGSAK